MEKGQKKTNKEEKLKNKTSDQEAKIEQRLQRIKEISSVHQGMKEIDSIQTKFGESYAQRKNFAKEIHRAKDNCSNLKEKVDEFLRQQNMLMIKLKGGFKKKGRAGA